MAQGKPWTDDEVEALSRMAEGGETVSAIARALWRTREAISRRANTMHNRLTERVVKADLLS
jgi:uncharacterized protein (DUF1697 family)